MTPSKSTTTAEKLLSKGRRYLQPKPEAEESETSASEESRRSKETQPSSSSGTSETATKDSSSSSSDRFSPGSDDGDDDDDDVSSEYPSADEPLARTKSRKKGGPQMKDLMKLCWMEMV